MWIINFVIIPESLYPYNSYRKFFSQGLLLQLPCMVIQQYTSVDDHDRFAALLFHNGYKKCMNLLSTNLTLDKMAAI